MHVISIVKSLNIFKVIKVARIQTILPLWVPCVRERHYCFPCVDAQFAWMVQIFFVLHVLEEDSAWTPTLENWDRKIIKKKCQSYFINSDSDSQ